MLAFSSLYQTIKFWNLKNFTEIMSVSEHRQDKLIKCHLVKMENF